jgi:hypothetical protein
VKPSPRQRLADLLLRRPVAGFIAERRADGASFAAIAEALRDATDGEIDVSDEAIRQWHLSALAHGEGVA